ncbi:hypothetical protein BVH01_08125 [Pseudomonas sp. PA1(2017)]|uniref:YrhB domain-containing protein n=1 Tax=Pseudomonas sp. PA1(2017) TaxID=1932113 RepID=UPI000961CCA5|nr:hypothetical protein BVH01_08125 [Pseudomonas sp. PA1(2017)]
MNFEESLSVVNDYLSRASTSLVVTHYEESPEGWLFCFNSKEYVDTGDFSSQLVGDGPVLVDKDTGEMHFFGTALPPIEYVKEYSLRKRNS